MLVLEPEAVAQPTQAVSSEQGISGTSTFKGEPERGGWIPIFTKYTFGEPTITDWICPVCNKLTSQSRTCPTCGLAKHEIPVYKHLRPDREHKSNYRLWMDSVLDPEDKDDGSCCIR